MTTNRKAPEVGVLGAGLMGSCLALDLARHGIKVDLFDLASQPITGASLHNEGKLHLGFVYAMDPRQDTYELMLRGSMAFTSIVERLTGATSESLLAARKFHYFIPRDSQLDVNQVQDHFQRVEDGIRALRQSGWDYFGYRGDSYFNRNSPSIHNRLFSASATLGSFSTEERSISTSALGKILQQAILQNPNIRFLRNTKVLSVNRLPGGDIEVESTQRKKNKVYRYPCVSNCLWDDKIRIDRSAGIEDPGPWVLRYKATIRITAPNVQGIPSATGVLGPYGDVVNHGGGHYYVSWYPRCKLAQSLDGEGRKLHDAIHSSRIGKYLKRIGTRYPRLGSGITAITHRKFIDESIREMAVYVPSMQDLLNNKKMAELGGGVILARGATDIDDPNSLLHSRSSVGPVAYGSYLTIDTGKYCTAPLFALEASEMIRKIL